VPQQSVDETLRLGQQAIDRLHELLRLTSECLERSQRSLEESREALYAAYRQLDGVTVISMIADGTFFAGCVEKRARNGRDEALADAALPSCHAVLLMR
jgi:hypothetical protein